MDHLGASRLTVPLGLGHSCSRRVLEAKLRDMLARLRPKQVWGYDNSHLGTLESVYSWGPREQEAKHGSLNSDSDACEDNWNLTS